MGLASSQARMLLLTARKSDLEYRAQCISQRKINLAMQTEQLANDYSNSMANMTMKLNYATVNGQAQYEKLSYAGITAENANYVGDYLVKTASGKYACTDTNDALKVCAKLAKAAGQDVDLSSMTASDKQTLLNSYKDKLTVISQMNNADYFQDALRNGGLFLQKKSRNAWEYLRE